MEMDMEVFSNKIYNMIKSVIESEPVKLKQTYYDENKLLEILHSYTNNSVNINISKLNNNNLVMSANASINIVMNVNANIERTTADAMEIVKRIKGEINKNLFAEVVSVYPNNEGNQIIFVIELETT